MMVHVISLLLPRLNDVKVRGILLTQASASALASASTPALKFCVKVFVGVYSSAPRAPSFTKFGVYILRYLKSHILASFEQDANVMHE